MLKKTLIELFERDLNRLIAEVNAYKNENDLWVTRGDIKNSGGNLCLHLAGNLNHFIGATLGSTGYIRQREDEFNVKHVLKKDLINTLQDCITMLTETLSVMPEADLAKDFPLEMQGATVTNTQMLVHLYGHLNYHLGQVNYHRRLLD